MYRLGWMAAITATTCSMATGCGDGSRPAAPPSAADRLDLGVVGVNARIGDGESLGSGFVVDADNGLVLTAAHRVWGARSLRLATAVGVLHGRIVARAPCDDLALLQVHPRIPGLAALPAAPEAASPGQLLRSVGRRRHDTGGESIAIASIPVQATGTARSDAAERSLPASGVPLDSPLVPEVSGGPVIDQAGRLIGMAEAMGAPGVASPAVVIPWERIRARLSELTPGPRTLYVGWADQYRCVGRQHAYARATHPGFQVADARLNAPIAPTRLPGAERMDG